MRPLKLHTKTALLASAITLAVLVVALVTISARVVDLVRDEQKALADWQARSLAEAISNLPAPLDPQEMAKAAALVRSSRPNVVDVRIWERAGGVFIERVAAAGSGPAEEIPEETKTALRSGLTSRVVTEQRSEADNTLYRVFAPTQNPGEHGRVSGAVEVAERLDNIPSIAVRYARQAAWIALVAVALTTFSTYLLFRRLVYMPIERLLGVIARAKAGELEAQAPPRPPDELGRLSQEFNSLLSQVREMTGERERRQALLRERVREATAQLQQRNEQLAATNLELWRTTRRLTQFERLAAAGQTAAQFAHEVGTPLNLISCHAQLMSGELRDNPDAAESRIDVIVEQIERIERIVRRMLDRTRAETAELKPLDLNTLLQSVCGATGPALETAQVCLETVFDSRLPLIAGDGDHLQQVFINLINNALDAMPSGGSLRIATSSADWGAPSNNGGGPQAVVDVADTGCGMSRETQARIFDPLYTTKERGKGTGLGLVVVSHVLQEHGGQIEVESEPGQGTRFRLRFPALKGAEALGSSVMASRSNESSQDLQDFSGFYESS
ncbi:MAG TPA: ATP-binding protein [Blastocatellia bacterium]|jgi:signal transduction histidine kinase|nr:ATP-binding protein [Blastocatellia bacterium]